MKNPFPKTPIQSPSQSQQQQLLQLLRSNPQLMKKYQEQLTKYQSMQKFKNVQQPMTNQQYLKNLKTNSVEKYLDEQGGLTIKPQEGFVLKFIDKRSSQKIFVNIVKHEAVDHPEEKQLVDFDNQVGLRIPMSMGVMREDRDKNGHPCKVVDVVMNPKIIATAQTNPDVFQFMGQIIANYLLEKHKITVSQQMMKKVKGLKYKGTDVQIQRVKAKKSPVIQQLSQQKAKQQQKRQSQEQKLFNEISGQYNAQKKVSRPDFRIYIQSLDGTINEYFFDSFKKENTKRILIEMDLSILIHSRGIHLEGSIGFLYLFVKGFYEICLKMPLEIQSYKAKFSLKQRKLYIEAYPLQIQLDSNIEVKQNEVNFNNFSNSEQQSKIKQNKNIKVEFENDLLDQLV